MNKTPHQAQIGHFCRTASTSCHKQQVGSDMFERSSWVEKRQVLLGLPCRGIGEDAELILRGLFAACTESTHMRALTALAGSP